MSDEIKVKGWKRNWVDFRNKVEKICDEQGKNFETDSLKAIGSAVISHYVSKATNHFGW